MNYQKYKTSGVQGLFRHCERYKDNQGQYIKFGNENIDISKTYLNYNLGPNLRGRTQFQKMDSILNGLEYRKQKNNITVCSWLMTAPKNLDPKDTKKFFETVYNQLCHQIGGEHKVISAFVHMDETTPHMHFLFVPQYDEPVQGQGFSPIRRTLSASKLTDRNVLQHAHDNMQNVIDTAFPDREYKIVQEDPEERATKSISLKDYKRMQSKIKELQSEVKNLNNTILKLVKDVDKQKNDLDVYKTLVGYYEDVKTKAAKEVEHLKSDIESLTDTKNTLLFKNRKLSTEIDNLYDTVQEIDKIVTQEIVLQQLGFADQQQQAIEQEFYYSDDDLEL